MMPTPDADSGAASLTQKLAHFATLSAEDVGVLQKITQERVHTVGLREDLIREGDVPRTVRVILSGWGCRYKVLEDGRRQIVSILLPGDFCDLDCFVLGRMDHSVGALTALMCAELSFDQLERLIESRPQIRRALRKDVLVSAAIQREWALNLGQRMAAERLAHLFCEVFVRLRAIGQTRGDTCGFPMTQADLADATGLSTVHVNRSLQELRGGNLIALSGKWLTIPDWEALQSVALFDDGYLHLDEDGRARA